MTHLAASSFNMQGALAQRSSVGELPPPISPIRITLSFLPLTAQVLPKNPALCFVRINMLVKRLMADGQCFCNLLRTPLHAHQRTGLFPYPRLNGWGIATVLRTLCQELTGLFGSISPRISITNQLPAGGGLVPIQQHGYLSLIVSAFHEYVNLISFSLAEVFVFQKQQRQARSRSLECYTSSAT